MSPAKQQSALQEALGHHRAGRLEKAAVLYDQVRKAAPSLFDPVHLAGTVAYQQGRYADAVSLLSRALKLDPRSAPCAMRLGLAWLAMGKPAEAERQFRASLAREATAEANNGLGLALRALGRPAEAIEAWKQAIAINPASAEVHDRLGALIADTQGFDQALPHFRKAVQLDPRYAPAWCNLGLACAQTGGIVEAFAAFDRALALDPQLHQARLGRALAHQKANRISEAIAEYGAVLEAQPANHEARSARLLCLNYLTPLTPTALFDEHRKFGQVVETGIPPTAGASAGPKAAVRAGGGRRLRVAFLSPDLRAHSVAYFLEPLLRHLDKTQFDLILYHDHAVVDAVSARLRDQAALWRHFASQPNAIVEERIRADAPDILVDLAGHTGFNRLPLFAKRLAPVQMTYLGYPNTTGLSAMDFRLTDALADPPGEADRLHTEQLIRFAPTAWVYQPPVSAPEPAAPPSASSASDTGVTFGSFNNAAKIADPTIALWAGVLAAVPGSKLLIKGHGLTDPEFQTLLRGRFQSLGIAEERIVLVGRTPNLESHLAAYNQVDIALDTFPYHGTTTTCEALWMGRPVVTLAGDRHASRVGVSLLTAVGHPEWIAATTDEYIAIAVRLAKDISHRVELAGSLRAQLSCSALLDQRNQAMRFGAALRGCYEKRVG